MTPPLKHVAIIMDGNRRWARAQNLKATQGHAQAANHAIEPLIEECLKQKIPYVTFWAFSTENWKRDKQELSELFRIFRSGLVNMAQKFIDQGVQLRILGDINRFPQDIAQKTLDLVNKTKKNTNITVSFALNYGGRDEILRTVKKILKKGIDPEKLDEKLFSSFLDTSDIPDPDLIIRTGGDKRLSGYLPWQSVYSEIYFTDVLFPNFTPKKLHLALQDFSQRDRRFGGDSKKKK